MSLSIMTWEWIDALDRRLADLRAGAAPGMQGRAGLIAMLERWRERDAEAIEAYWGPHPAV